jgi:chloride channel protein, CIC family
VRVLVAAGAAAGLATAFNAPIAGGVFILEERLKRFDPRTTLATLVASAAGFISAHLLPTTPPPPRTFARLAAPTLSQAPLVLVVGVPDC